jgi:hypothetical protein
MCVRACMHACMHWGGMHVCVCTCMRNVPGTRVEVKSKICELNCKTYIEKNTIEIDRENKCYFSDTNNDAL